MPVAPPFGGKLKRTIATLRLARSDAAQADEAHDPFGQALDPFRMRAKVALGALRSGLPASAEHRRRRGPVELGDRDHHGRLDRRKAAVRGFPLLDRLEFEGVGGDIGDVEVAEKRRRAGGVVIGGAADQREAGQGDEGVDRRNAVALEEGVDRGARVKAAREGRNNSQAPRLEGGDHGVVVGRVVGEQVRTHEQEADRPDGLLDGGPRQRVDIFAETTGGARVIDADLGILDGQRRLERAAQAGVRAARVTIEQEPHETDDILVRTGEPVLQGKEIGAHVLRRAWNETQDLRDPAQHRELLFAAGVGRLRASAQAL